MENKNSYTGRTGNSKAPSSTQRRPSGFSTVDQAPKRSAAKPAVEEKKPKKQPKIKKEKTKRTPGKRKFSLKRVLVGCLIVFLVGLILLVIFGDRGTYHQMPTITREEAEGSFAPEETPLPGVEEAI